VAHEQASTGAIGASHIKHLRSALRRVGLCKVRFSDLRDAFASNLRDAGTDIVWVSKPLGFTNVQLR
jgi:hypothetical protein